MDRHCPLLQHHVAVILQEDLAETSVGWGQARPACPHHPHPARPVIRDGEAWWICERDDELLYHIGRGEVPTRSVSPPSWRKTRSRRAEKRRGREDGRAEPRPEDSRSAAVVDVRRTIAQRTGWASTATCA